MEACLSALIFKDITLMLKVRLKLGWDLIIK